MVKVSIVVPIYNVQRFLPRCLDSILCQTLEDIEIIAVDDGSNDMSSSILDGYALKDSRIKAIHTENRGVSAARNLALSMSNGEYVGFVDSDDWIEPNMFSALYSEATTNNSDVVVCGCHPFNDGKIDRKLSGREAILAMFDANGLMQGYSWTRLIKRSCIGNLQYDENLRCFEDLVFFYHLFGRCTSVYWHDVPLYHYEANPDSAIHVYKMNPNKRIGYDELARIASIEEDSKIAKAIKRFLYLSYVNMAIDYVSHGNVFCPEFSELKEVVRGCRFVFSCNTRQFFWRFVVLSDWLKRIYWRIKGVAEE